MSPTDAAALALLATHSRRFAFALIRVLMDRARDEDIEALPPRLPQEPLLRWACRCRAPAEDSGRWTDEASRLEREAGAQLRRGRELDLHAISMPDGRYPPLLAAIADPPPLLWVKGDAASWQAPCVALVGSRAATPYGLSMSRRIAADIASAGVVVVSGLARGVDAAAHAAAVGAGGRTIGVLGCGVDRVYPPEHHDLAAEIERAGALVSEFPPRVPPLPHHFPLRNRIISGLCAAVVVVEAPEKSGALITASAALEQGRDVMVVPGPAAGGRNRGGHLLIRDGARVVESAADIMEELGWVQVARTASAAPLADPQLPDAADFTLDDVTRLTGELPQAALARLLDLELSGRIQRVEGGRFIRVLT